MLRVFFALALVLVMVDQASARPFRSRGGGGCSGGSCQVSPAQQPGMPVDGVLQAADRTVPLPEGPAPVAGSPAVVQQPTVTYRQVEFRQTLLERIFGGRRR